MKSKNIKCSFCNGKGTFKYHWTECGNSQIDEWVDEDCKYCNKTGHIKIGVPVKLYDKYGIKEKTEIRPTIKKIEALMKLKEKEISSLEKDLIILGKQLLELHKNLEN